MKIKYLLVFLVFVCAQTVFADVCLIQYGFFNSDTEKGVLKTCGINTKEFLIAPTHFMQAPNRDEAMTESLSKMRNQGYRVVSCENGFSSCLIEK